MGVAPPPPARLEFAGLEGTSSAKLRVRDPDGRGHMVVELFEGSVGRAPAA